MKRFLSAFFFMIYFLVSCYYNTTKSLAAETPSQLYAKAAILMDADNQRVLWGKDEELELPMASTTKIMTCLYALEHGTLSDVVTFSKRASLAPKVHLGTREGDQYILSDLLYALMLESYNDAAIAVAEHISGSVEQFCKDMTIEARNYGCYHTSFETPNGLDSKNHYTTCRDLALLTSHALKKPDFRKIIGETSYSIKELTSGQSHTLSNKNSFLSSYPGAIGVKTGFTSMAGYCFVGAVETADRLLISVVLGSGWYPNRTFKWTDTKKLMNFGTENYQPKEIPLTEDIPVSIPVIKGEKASCTIGGPPPSTVLLLGSEETTSCITQLPDTLKAPIEKGDSIGSVTLYIDDKVYRTYPVYATQPVKKLTYGFCFQNLLKKWYLWFGVLNS